MLFLNVHANNTGGGAGATRTPANRPTASGALRDGARVNVRGAQRDQAMQRIYPTRRNRLPGANRTMN